MDDLIIRFIPRKKWWQRTRWEIQKDFKFFSFLIPTGFISDGASIPRIFWLFFSPVGSHFPAAILHDYLLQHSKKPRREIDKIFLKAMKYLKVPFWRRWSMHAGVRIGGAFTKKKK